MISSLGLVADLGKGASENVIVIFSDGGKFTIYQQERFWGLS